MVIARIGCRTRAVRERWLMANYEAVISSMHKLATVYVAMDTDFGWMRAFDLPSADSADEVRNNDWSLR